MNNAERFAQAVQWAPIDRLMTYDFVDNGEILMRYGGYDPSKTYTFEELIHINARAFKRIGLDVTRYIYDPANHWMGSKIQNWVRFFGVDADAWEVSQKGDTAWISRRPFRTLAELEKHLPNLPRHEEIEAWYKPFIQMAREIFAQYDIVFIGAVEGPFTDAYSYMDMELFSLALYQAPELVSHILDCTGRFSASIAQVFAQNASAPLLFMGEDICGSTGPIFSPDIIRREGLPRWRWIMDPIKAAGCKFLFHTDGLYGDFLKLILEDLGADGLNPIERNGLNDIFEIRERYPDKLLFGNVCCVTTLPGGAPADVEDETLELIERIGAQGGLFIGSSSEIHDRVPVENAVTMYQTVQQYGGFPIDVDRIRSRRRELRPALRLRAAD